MSKFLKWFIDWLQEKEKVRIIDKYGDKIKVEIPDKPSVVKDSEGHILDIKNQIRWQYVKTVMNPAEFFNDYPDLAEKGSFYRDDQGIYHMLVFTHLVFDYNDEEEKSEKQLPPLFREDDDRIIINHRW